MCSFVQSFMNDTVNSASGRTLAASVRPELLFTASFMNDWTNEHIAGHQPRSQAGVGSAPSGAGLGVEVDLAMLGAPRFSAS